MYAGGHGVVVDDDKYRAYRKLAKQRWQAACDGTATRWCTPLAGMVDDDGEPEVAMKLLARACDHGDRNACVESAKRGLMKGTVKPDAALGEATRQCQAGNGHGCGVAGAMLVLGEHGVARDARRGFELEKRACALGEKTSCAGAGSAYATGEVVAKDDKLARRHFEMACDRRLARACLAIAQDAVSQHDTRRAVEFGRRACQMNNGEACELVATAQLAAGNDADGIRWATEACRMGRGTVCGVLVERDLELPVPPHIKPQLYSEGCKAGLPAACKHVAK
jgi:TPR repeat protein